MKEAVVKEQEEPKQKIDPAIIDKMGLGISGYTHYTAVEPTDGNLATGLGCTMAGFTGTYNIISLNHALAIRIAAVKQQGYATYVILNLAHPDRGAMEDWHGADSRSVYAYLIQAGWKVLAEMPGAHGSYLSYLMGARTAKTEKILMEMVAEEIKLAPKAQYPVMTEPEIKAVKKERLTKGMAKPKGKLPK